jgi:hypothetical protein
VTDEPDPLRVDVVPLEQHVERPAGFDHRADDELLVGVHVGRQTFRPRKEDLRKDRDDAVVGELDGLVEKLAPIRVLLAGGVPVDVQDRRVRARCLRDDEIGGHTATRRRVPEIGDCHALTLLAPDLADVERLRRVVGEEPLALRG